VRLRQYPKTVYMVLYGSDKIGNAGLGVGDTVTVQADAESRRHNERWYTEIKAWKIKKD
jgi:hypothetical protein